MLGDISAVDDIYIVCGYTDMRKQIDGLYSIVKDQFHMDPVFKTGNIGLEYETDYWS